MSGAGGINFPLLVVVAYHRFLPDVLVIINY